MYNPRFTNIRFLNLILGLFLFHAFVAALSLPAKANSIWLTCGTSIINLDQQRERFTNLFSNTQGKARFLPSQISFEDLWLDDRNDGGMKDLYVIDRATLNYTKQVLARTKTYIDTGWEVRKSEKGTCKITKNPTQNNKI